MSDVNESNPRHDYGGFERPPQMTDVHIEVLNALWLEGKTPTSMKEELLELFPELKPHEARNIVGYWMWDENINLRKPR